MARTKATRIVAIAKAFDKSITESGTALASATSRDAASELIEYATRSHTVPVDVLLSLTDALEVLRLQYIALAASVSGVPVDGYAEYAITRSALKFAMLHRDNKTDTALAHDHAYAIVKYAARAASPPRAVLNVLRNAVAVFDRQLAEETAALAHVEAEADALAAAPPPLLTGLDPTKIVAELDAFRAGTRSATVMDRIAKGFSHDESVAIASWLAAQQ